MAKLIAVTGATGQQGGAVVTVMLAAGWRVRGVTRDPGSAKAKRLAATGVEIVKADFSDENSLQAAFDGAHAIFAMTSFIDYAWSGKHTVDEACALEEADALRLARAAASSETLQHYIFSTTPSASRLTGGKCPVPHMDAKARADQRIRRELPGLARRMTSLFVGFYPSNFVLDMFKPHEVLRFNASVEDWLEGLGGMFVTATELGVDEFEIGGFRHALEVIKNQL
ncbi:hypothetical protein K4K53_010245 [Colletotrichum sp. SAR 10_77]|nr:hypothetical protein K4K53_010245 [Colletotrichum sp. SAR 10_77]